MNAIQPTAEIRRNNSAPAEPAASRKLVREPKTIAPEIAKQRARALTSHRSDHHWSPLHEW